jgi:hypothetical protein
MSEQIYLIFQTTLKVPGFSKRAAFSPGTLFSGGISPLNGQNNRRQVRSYAFTACI